MIRWLVVAAVIAGCSKTPSSSEAPPAVDDKPHSKMTEAEIVRGRDACTAYVDKICACATTKPDLKRECQLSKARPEALRISHEVSLSPDSSAKDVAQMDDVARKTIKGCFEDLAKLPTLGCTP